MVIIKKNISLMYVYIFLNTFLLFKACDTLYYLQKGVSSSGYIIFIVITYFVSLVFEIPSGVIADKFSKRKILLVSNSLLLISILFFIIASNYWFLVIAIILLAMQSALNTGIVNTIIYNTIDDKDEFSKYLFYKSFFLYSSYLIAMIIGGYVGSKNLVSMYYISLIPVILNFIFILLIDESKLKGNNKDDNKEILKDAINNVKNNNSIIYIFLSYSMMGAILTVIAESHPEYAKDLGISAFIIGIYTAIMCLFHIFGEYISSRIKNKNIFLYSIPILVGIDSFIIGYLNSILGIIFIVLIQFLWALYSNSMLSVLHRSISSKSRVTVESLLSLTASIFGIVVGLLSSIIANYFSISNSYMILGVIMILYSVIILSIKFKLKKHHS